MRTSRLVFLAVLFMSAARSLAACSNTPAVTVIHGPPAEPIKGDSVKLRRGAQEPYAGVHGGYFVVRTRDDWRRLFDKGEPPALPPTLELDRQMLVLGLSESTDVVELKIDRAIETAELVHVFAHEVKLGEGCAQKNERPAFDAVVTPRLDKPVRFYVEESRAESCGPPPAPVAQCRVGTNPTWSAKVAAAPGDKIDCEMTAEPKGRFAIVDRALGIAELPPGSSSKLTYAKGTTRGAFTVDVFGTYLIHAEATDESGRKGVGEAAVEVLPPRSNDVVVELVWTGFDATDDPDTFPRTKLRVNEPVPHGSKAMRGRECSAEAKNPAVCEVKSHGAYTLMTLKSGDKHMPLSVHYVDERVDKGPLVCLQIFTNGARTGEACDRLHRNAGETWEAGLVDLSTGRLVDPATLAAQAAAAAAAAADAGAEGGTDAGKK